MLWWAFLILAPILSFIWFFSIRAFGVVGTVVLVLSALSLLIGVAGGVNHFHGTSEVVVPTAVTKSGTRQFASANPEYLADFFKQHTTIQAEKLLAPFIDKWMRVLGSFGDVKRNGCADDLGELPGAIRP